MTKHLTLTNGTAAPIDAIPLLDFAEFSDWLHAEVQDEARVSAFFGIPQQNCLRIYALLSRDRESTMAISSTEVSESYPAFTPTLPSLHLFERELFEQFQVVPEDHPWLKPVRFDRHGGPEIGMTNFYAIEGEEVHEVAVGPIHAGIIECGHFRFQCQGEMVMHLEISLGYHHRGIEAACNTGPTKRTLPLMEALSGDTSIGHTWAYCSLIEGLADFQVSPRGQALRSVALELERLANHTGDMGALAGDIGYLPTSSFCGRLRGDYLNMTAMLCGNRFGRGLVCPGGTAHDIDAGLCKQLAERLAATARDTKGAIALMWKPSSVTARMMGRGIVPPKAAQDLGLVGPAARACNLMRDVRTTHPLAHLRSHDMNLHTCNTGDVYARALIREKEIEESVTFIQRVLQNIPEGEVCTRPAEAPKTTPGGKYHLPLAPLSVAASLVEGWRGEICHIAMTDAQGAICRYKVVDPSFHNWIGLALSLRSQQISDFPLCNKSFNLSYCGHDL